MKMLRISKDLSLPLDTVTQTIAILARKRSGKSYTARRLAEQLIHAMLQVVIVDPKGDWWGMRSSPDGKSPGLSILILGGEHGDLPLEVGSGELVAKLVVEERVSVVLDLSMFRKSEVAKFMTDFAENLYRLKAKEQYRTPVLLIVDEADAVAPQKPQHGEERMLGAIEDIVRRGGQRGLGCALVTQRSAVLNKNVLTQAQVMIALRTIAPQDLKAMDAWIDVHGTVEQRAELMASLPSLPRGDAWVWSPGWPTDGGIFQRVHVAPIETFDSGATPKPGERRVEPKKRADVDLAALRRQMAATIEKAKASDPALLRKRVAELERELAKKPPAPSGQADSLKIRRVEVPVIKPAELKRLEQLFDRVEATATKLNKAHVDFVSDIGALAGRIVSFQSAARRTPPPAAPRSAAPLQVNRAAFLRPERGVTAAEAPRRPTKPRQVEGDGSIGKGEQIVLTAAAQHQDGVSREQLSVLTGYKRATRNTYLQRLGAAGLIDLRGDRICATDEGRAALGPDFVPLPIGPELVEHWRHTLPSGELAVLEVLLAAYPEAVDRENISTSTEFSRATRNTYLQRLRSRQLVIEAGRGMVRASPTLFAEAT